MKWKAFSLVELMVVVAIIALLMMILMPSLTTARSLARSAVCRSNLRELGAAFQVSHNLKLSKGPGYWDLSRLYPEGTGWPGTPLDAVPQSGIYQCPEDDLYEANSFWGNLVYLSPQGLQIDLSQPDSGSWYISRTGNDEDGAYREWAIQDDGNTEGMDWHGWIDTDGVFRVYASGLIWIIGTVPDTPEFSGAHPRETSSCGDGNRLYLDDRAAFPNDGFLHLNRNQKYWLDGWRGLTNYGINARAYKPGDPHRIVLLDYVKIVADPGKPLETQELLHYSARHLGRLNVLAADQSVTVKSALELSPQLHPGQWDPDL